MTFLLQTDTRLAGQRFHNCPVSQVLSLKILTFLFHVSEQTHCWKNHSSHRHNNSRCCRSGVSGVAEDRSGAKEARVLQKWLHEPCSAFLCLLWAYSCPQAQSKQRHSILHYCSGFVVLLNYWPILTFLSANSTTRLIGHFGTVLRWRAFSLMERKWHSDSSWIISR